MNDDWIYLDYNASTPMDAEVVRVMQECLAAQAHPSSGHPHGKLAKRLLESAREQVAGSIGCQESEIVFCSGSTEASNHVIKGVAFSNLSKLDRQHFITSSVDHPATTEPLRFLEKLGHKVTVLPVDQFGLIDPEQVAQAIESNTVLVSLLQGQNEVGSVMPLEKIGQICQARGVLFHVDASQSFGKIEVDVNNLKADFLNIAGHKIYGPKGIGALFVRQGRILEPLLHGGGHEMGFRSGTPAAALIAGLGVACRLVKEKGLIPEQACQELWRYLQEKLGSAVVRNGHPQHRLPNVLHATFQGVSGAKLLETARISASTGAACHSAEMSPVLRAMGFDLAKARGSVRLSTGRNTSLTEVAQASERLVQAYQASLEKVAL